MLGSAIGGDDHRFLFGQILGSTDLQRWNVERRQSAYDGEARFMIVADQFGLDPFAATRRQDDRFRIDDEIADGQAIAFFTDEDGVAVPLGPECACAISRFRHLGIEPQHRRQGAVEIEGDFFLARMRRQFQRRVQ